MSVYSAFAAEIAAEAGAMARRRYFSGKFNVTKKNGGELVTDVDNDLEEFLRESIAQKYPDHGFFGEESGSVGDMDKCWVIDPIDGTTNFIHKYTQCAVSVALCDGGRPVAGAVHDIVGNETFVASRGEGAYVDGRRMRTTSVSALEDSLFLAGGNLSRGMWPLMRTLSRETAGMRRGGSVALDMAYVAAGRADMLACGPARFWDVAAGVLLIREAGGLMSDVSGGTSFAFGEKTKCFVAGAPGVMGGYVSALRRHCA